MFGRKKEVQTSYLAYLYDNKEAITKQMQYAKSHETKLKLYRWLGLITKLISDEIKEIA